MKGLLYLGPHNIQYHQDIAKPTLSHPDDVILKVGFCGICGTDLHEMYEEAIFFAAAASETGDKISGKKLPLVIGHELSGVVEQVGSNVVDLKPGDHVVVESSGHCSDRLGYYKYDTGKPPCQSCDLGYPNTCTDLNFIGLGVDNGGLAEYTKYSQQHVLKISNDIPLDAAALIEPLSVVWHAASLANFSKGESALILGAGPIGLATILVLKALGASKIVVSEPALIRREQAAKLGATVFNPMEFKTTEEGISHLRSLGLKGQGFDKSFDCSGIQSTYTTSIQALRAHGVACNVAIWPHKSVAHFVMDLTSEEKTSVGSLGYVTDDFRGVIKAVEAGLIKIDEMKTLITAKVNYENGVAHGFEELIHNKDKHIKVLIGSDV